MISQTESLVHLCIAAGVSTAMIGLGLRGKAVKPHAPRRVRWLLISAGALASLMTLYVAYAEASISGRAGSDALTLGGGGVTGATLGIVLLWTGLRGKQIGDHPHCRCCGFDLFGKPAASSLCNECGSDLASPRATVVGVKQRRMFPLLAGAFLLTIGAATAVSIGTAIVKGGAANLAPYKPTWWLARQANSPGESEAESELIRRLLAGNFDNATVESIAASLDSTNTNQAFAGTFAERAWAAGQLSANAMQRNIRQRFTYVGTVAKESTPTRIAYEVSVGKAWPPSFQTRLTWQVANAYEINGFVTPLDFTANPNADVQLRKINPAGSVLKFATPLALGPTRVRIVDAFDYTYTVPGRPTLTEHFEVASLDGMTTIVDPRDHRFPDDGQRDPLGGRMLALVQFQRRGNAMICFLHVETRSTAIFAGKAFLKIGSREFDLGDLSISHGRGHTSKTLQEPVPPGVIEVILRPTDDLAGSLISPPPTSQREVVISEPTVIPVSGSTR